MCVDAFTHFAHTFSSQANPQIELNNSTQQPQHLLQGLTSSNQHKQAVQRLNLMRRKLQELPHPLGLAGFFFFYVRNVAAAALLVFWLAGMESPHIN